jgi:dihydropyrimidinase
MMARTLIEGGTVVTATDTYAADVAIVGEKIAAIFSPGDARAAGDWDVTIDATGKYVLPGGVDVHTHLDMPMGGTSTIDDFASGTLAAAHGGTTCIVDFATPRRGEALRQGLDAWHAKADGKTAIDYAFHMVLTDVNDATVDEMGRLVDEGITSFKMFMAYPGALLVDDAQIFRAMQRAGELGGLVCMHAENGLPIDVLVRQALAKGHTTPGYHASTRPQIAEAEGTHRAICLAEMAGAPVYIVHLSAERALESVVAARDRGLPVYAETCPQYLFASEDDLARTSPEWGAFEGAKFVCTPPLRPKAMQDALWRGLRTNDLQVVSTDHCSFCMKGQKELGRRSFAEIPNGMPGIETRLFLLWDGGVRTGRISVNRFVELTATAPAKLFGLHPRKGSIAIGADADLLVWDGEKKHTLRQSTQHMRADYAPFEGREVVGFPTYVLSRGEVIVDDGRYRGAEGDGRFVKRGAPAL